MHYKSPTFIVMLTACSIAFGMKDTDLTWAFATISILDKEDPASIKLLGVDESAQSTHCKEQLKNGILSTLQAIGLEYPNKESVQSTVTVDLTKLQLVTRALAQLKLEEQKLMARQQQLIEDKAIADATKEAFVAWQDYHNLRHKLCFFTGITEFWNHKEEFNNRISELRNIAISKQDALRRIDRYGKRFNPTFKQEHGLEEIDTCSQTSALW